MTNDQTLWRGLGRKTGHSERKELYAKLLGYGTWYDFMEDRDRNRMKAIRQAHRGARRALADVFICRPLGGSQKKKKRSTGHI